MDKSINSKIIPKSLVASVSVSAFLIGKAQEDFWNWYLLPETLSEHKLSSVFKYSNENAIKVSFLARSKTEQQSLIIEWFDSVGFYINIELIKDRMLGYIRGFDSEVVFIFHGDLITNNSDCIKDDIYETRFEAISKAIQKANEVYNVKFFQDEH